MIAERSSNVCAACCTTTNNVTENFTFYPADEDEQMRSHWRGILENTSIADAMAGEAAIERDISPTRQAPGRATAKKCTWHKRC